MIISIRARKLLSLYKDANLSNKEVKRKVIILIGEEIDYWDSKLEKSNDQNEKSKIRSNIAYLDKLYRKNKISNDFVYVS